MGNIIDFLLSNPIFLMILIGVILSFGKDDKKKKQRQKQQRERQGRRSQGETAAPKSLGETIRETISSIEDEFKKMADPDSEPGKSKEQYERSKSEQTVNQEVKSQPLGRFAVEEETVDRIEEQRQKQYEKLAGNIAQAAQFEADEEVKPQLLNKQTETQSAKLKQGSFKKNFKKQLTKEGLVNSIVMAEILGPPRAKRPYENVLTKRRR